MNKYRLMVHKHDKLLGHFESDTPWAREAVRDISRCLVEAGYELKLLVSNSERRLLDSGPDGIRVLSSEPIFKNGSL